MGWNKLSGTGVATALEIVQRPTPFLTRHSASRLGGVTPVNKLPHSLMQTDEFTQTGATLKKNDIKKQLQLNRNLRVTHSFEKPGAWEYQGNLLDSKLNTTGNLQNWEMTW